MTTTSYLCRHLTWTKLFVLVGSSVPLIVTSGCSFSDYSKSSTQSSTLTPACAESSTLSPVASTPEGIVAQWKFDEDLGATTPPWLDSQEQRKLALKPGNTTPAAALTRLNGQGHALLLDGNTYVQSDDDETLFPDVSADPGFTISAWISLRLEDFKSADTSATRIWPIISTLGIAEHCGGYQLDVRSEANVDGPILAFSYEYPAGDAGATCSTPNVLKIPLRTPSWSWGFGRWHHVVATYTKLENEQAALALFWDGTRLATDTPASSTYDGSITFTDHVLYAGSNGRVTTSTDGTSHFKGHIDDVALFNRVLSESEISNFSLASSTFPGPSNCRWNSLEQWDFDAGSLSTWNTNTNPTPTSATLSVNDLYWGAGFLSARLLPERDLGLFDTAYLTADVPRGTSNPPRPFEFSISSGDDSCSWMLQGNGADRYVIDLTQPSFCVSTSCSFKPDRAQWARVQSEWAGAWGSFDITVTRLEFDTTRSPTAEKLPLGGAIGPEGWCWRPQAYNPGALASWNGPELPSPQSLSAKLVGPNQSTARLMADFGDQLLDLTNCVRVEIDADLPKLSGQSYFNFALIDAHGAVRNWDLFETASPISLGIATGETYDSFGKIEFPGVPRFTRSQVVQLGIEKPFAFATSANSPLLVNIRSIRFFDDKGRQGCEIPSKR